MTGKMSFESKLQLIDEFQLRKDRGEQKRWQIPVKITMIQFMAHNLAIQNPALMSSRVCLQIQT